jgi:quinol-cytochrome oxidoreductase complex cytochrome b subunit
MFRRRTAHACEHGCPPPPCSYGYWLLGVAAVTVAALDLQVILLWSAFVGSIVCAILAVIGGLLLLLPLQFLPATQVNDRKKNKVRTIAISVLWILYGWTSFHASHNPGIRGLFTLLTTVVVALIATAAAWTQVIAFVCVCVCRISSSRQLPIS